MCYLRFPGIPSKVDNSKKLVEHRVYLYSSKFEINTNQAELLDVPWYNIHDQSTITSKSTTNFACRMNRNEILYHGSELSIVSRHFPPKLINMVMSILVGVGNLMRAIYAIRFMDQLSDHNIIYHFL